MTDLLAGLNEGQKSVATWFGSPVVVLAGAGTGKTRALTHRIAYGVTEGHYRPENTLALTFTQKAAAEMAGRLRLLGVDQVSARTFHSAALRQLQHFWPKLTGGFLPDILPSKASLVAHVLETMRIAVDQAVLRDIAAEVEWRKVKSLSPDDYRKAVEAGVRTVPAGLSADDMVDVFTRYEAAKTERKRIDFEDVLLLGVGMLESEPGVLAQVRQRYQHFLVDEYQDVSPIQQRLLDVWLGPSRDVCVVGDASQTIYTFAGATSDYLLGFPDALPDAHLIRLETNYRSTMTIVEMANRVIHNQPGALTLVAHSGPGPDIDLIDEDTDDQEAEAIAKRVVALNKSGTPLGDVAILHRYSAQMLAVEGALRHHGLSVYVQGGTRFFDQPHVKRAVMEIRGAAVAGVQGSIGDVVTDILYGVGYQAKEPDHRGAERSVWEDLRALIDLAERADQAMTLNEFSDELVKRAASHDEPDRDAITLTTVHAAKGREWPVVVVMGLTEGNFPISYAKTDTEIAEEQRLFYVAVTRAQQRLILSLGRAQRQGAATQRTPSRFLRALKH
jgi:DNA helicase-2/ATP-dependent DNA helicase PcrA